MSDLPISVTIVTFNSARVIRLCLDHLFEAYPDGLRVIVVDNASTDGTQRILEQYSGRLALTCNAANNGFAGGQNQAIRLTTTPWVLTLNPDVRLTAAFLPRLLAAAAADPSIGTVCGKLLSMTPDFHVPDRSNTSDARGLSPLLDSTGIYFTPELRHFDRGSRQPDRGQYDSPQFVFGATGAAALYRRQMIDSIAIEGEFFDEDFFAYREDADVAWRAQLLGWRCLYVPDAVAYHVRAVLPSNRNQVSALVNRHSVKNRFLMRIKNIDGLLYRRHFAAITFRDVLVLAACLVREWSSLPAFWFVVRHWRKTWAKRKAIMSRRRVPPAEIAGWFAPHPVAR